MDIVINKLLCLFKTGSGKLAEGFFFEVGEEVLHRCIIPAITSPGHRRENGRVFGEDSIAMRDILVTMIRV